MMPSNAEIAMLHLRLDDTRNRRAGRSAECQVCLETAGVEIVGRAVLQVCALRRLADDSWPSAMSCSASGARISSAIIAAPHSALDLLPGQSRGQVLQQVGLPPGEFLLLPVVDRHRLG